MKIQRFNEAHIQDVYVKWGNRLKREFSFSKAKGFYDYEYSEDVDDENDQTLLNSSVEYSFYFHIGHSPDIFDDVAKFFREMYNRGYDPHMSFGRHDKMKSHEPQLPYVSFSVPLYEMINRLKILKATSRFDL